MTPINDLFDIHQEFHSDLQMDSFITMRSGGTGYGCLKQSLRELTTRKLALIQRYANEERVSLEIEELAAGPKSRRTDIDLWEKSMMLGECVRVIGDTEREFIRFYFQACGYQELLESQGVSFPLDAATRYRLDCEMWEHQLKCMAAIDFLTVDRLQKNTAELLQSLPPEMRKRVAENFVERGKLIDWYFEYEAPVPAAKIEECNVRKLIECSISSDSQRQYKLTGKTDSPASKESSWQTASGRASPANTDAA